MIQADRVAETTSPMEYAARLRPAVKSRRAMSRIDVIMGKPGTRNSRDATYPGPLTPLSTGCPVASKIVAIVRYTNPARAAASAATPNWLSQRLPSRRRTYCPVLAARRTTRASMGVNRLRMANPAQATPPATVFCHGFHDDLTVREMRSSSASSRSAVQGSGRLRERCSKAEMRAASTRTRYTSRMTVRKLSPRWAVAMISVRLTEASCRSMPSATAARCMARLTRYEPVPDSRSMDPSRTMASVSSTNARSSVVLTLMAFFHARHAEASDM